MRTNLNQEATELFAREIIFRAIFSGGGVSAIPASETAMEIWLRVWLAFPDLRLVPFFFTATGGVRVSVPGVLIYDSNPGIHSFAIIRRSHLSSLSVICRHK
jgi:hypothetical protein